MTWTPYQIEIVLYHHCCVGPFPRHDAPAYPQVVDALVDIGVLKAEFGTDDVMVYRTTALGEALVTMWLETPLPVLTYVDPRMRGAA